MCYNKSMNITLIQQDILWQQKENNLKRLDSLISSIYKTDLILLPEMFNTAFCPEKTTLSETMNGETLAWMKEISKIKKCSIAGTLMVREDTKVYNRLVWVSSNGCIHTYDKFHLFSLSKEDKYIEKGNKRLIISENGWKICPLICYDLRFPVFCRNNIDYDLLIFLANWPAKRIDSWNTLLRARSIENQCYTIGLNRSGSDENGIIYSGESKVFDAFGNELYSCTKGNEQLLQIDIRLEDIKLKRRQMNFLKDRDKFIIQ